jgi:hypothetical protein
MREWWIAKDVDGSGHSLTEGNIPEFTWSDWVKHENPVYANGHKFEEESIRPMIN